MPFLIIILTLFIMSPVCLADQENKRIQMVEDLLGSLSIKEVSQRRTLMIKLVDLYRNELIKNQNLEPERASQIRLKAISILESLINGKVDQVIALEGEAKIVAQSQLAHLFKDQGDLDRANKIWKTLVKNYVSPEVAADAAIALGEQEMDLNSKSQTALEYFNLAENKTRNADFKMYVLHKKSWILFNLGRFREATKSAELALYDSKGQVREEVLKDLILFQVSGQDRSTLDLISFHENLENRLGRTDLIEKLFEQFKARGDKPNGKIILEYLVSKRKELIFMVQLLEETMATKDWSSFSIAVEKLGDMNSKNTSKIHEIKKIMARIALQLEADAAVDHSVSSVFAKAVDKFLELSFVEEKTSSYVKASVLIFPEGPQRVTRLKKVLDIYLNKISLSEELGYREQLIASLQKLKLHQEASVEAKLASARAKETGEVRRFKFVEAAEYVDGGELSRGTELFQDLIKQDAKDEIGRKSAESSVKISLKERNYAQALKISNLWLEKISKEDQFPELPMILSLRDRAKFELAVLDPNKSTALTVFRDFCIENKLTPKSCLNAKKIAFDLEEYDELATVIRYDSDGGKELESLYESIGRFKDAATSYEKSGITKSRGFIGFLHVATLYEISGEVNSRNRVLMDMLSKMNQTSFSSTKEEDAVLIAILDVGLAVEALKTLKWSKQSRCRLLDQWYLKSEGDRQREQDLLSCSFDAGNGWAKLILKRAHELDQSQKNIEIKSENLRKSLSKKITALGSLRAFLDAKISIANVKTGKNLAAIGEAAFRGFSEDVLALNPQNESSDLQDLIQPYVKKSKDYELVVKNDSKEYFKDLPNELDQGEVSRLVSEMAKKSTRSESMNKLKNIYEKNGNLRVAGYFDGRLKSTSKN